MMALTGATTEYTGFGNVDLVIEAVFEDIDLKHRVLREVEPLLSDDAIYASNTSTIPITHIAEVAKRPEQVLGMHFFSPVHKMPLLEVIATARTAKEATATAVAYGKQLGKPVLAEALGLRMTPAEAMRRVVTAGRLGRKGRNGFYKYDANGKKGDVDESIYQIIGAGARANAGQHVQIPEEEMVRRCVLAMVN